jgi:DNA-binding transcriptional ArsR family regulator
MVCYIGCEMTSANLLLHPVRLRILKAFMGDRHLTTSQLAAGLPDVPQASVYRHVARLATAGVLEVIAECRVRGAVERTYALRPAAARISPEDAAAMTLEEHAHAFLTYVAGLLADFDRYLAAAPEPGRDGASYQLAGMWLTDVEFADFALEFSALAERRLASPPTPERRRRLLYTVVLPASEALPSDASPS